MARALVVEKHDAARTLIADEFDGTLQIESAATVQAGLDAHARDPFDLVIWDTVSAPPQCFTIVKTIKRFLKSPADTRAIVLSDTKEPEIIPVRNLRCEWLHQPVDKKELLALVETATQP